MDNTAISDFLVEARRFLEPRWDEWRRERGRDLQPGAPVSRDMCRFSALFLAEALGRATGDKWVVVGGQTGADPGVTDEFPPGIGGMQAFNSTWHDHYWVVDDEGDRLVDITADQFGHDAIIVTDTDDLRYAANYEDWAVAEDLDPVRHRVRQWLERASQEIEALRSGAVDSDHAPISSFPR